MSKNIFVIFYESNISDQYEKYAVGARYSESDAKMVCDDLNGSEDCSEDELYFYEEVEIK